MHTKTAWPLSVALMDATAQCENEGAAYSACKLLPVDRGATAPSWKANKKNSAALTR